MQDHFVSTAGRGRALMVNASGSIYREVEGVSLSSGKAHIYVTTLQDQEVLY